MNNEGLKRIKEAGLKLTPQRRRVYEAMMQLRHATVDDIIALVQSKDREVTVSTIYQGFGQLLFGKHFCRSSTIPIPGSVIMTLR